MKMKGRRKRIAHAKEFKQTAAVASFGGGPGVGNTVQTRVL